ILSIIGPNGAGKSSIFNLSSRIYSPTSGKVYFENQDLTAAPAFGITKLGIARTFQNIELFEHATVLSNLLVGRHRPSTTQVRQGAGNGNALRSAAASGCGCRLSRHLRNDAMSAPDIILKLSNIESYYGPIMAIRGICIEVPRGQIVTLLGANGAGKTTVLKTISGILDPQKVSIEFLG